LLERRKKQAAFCDQHKTLDTFDFAFNPKMNRSLVFDLATAAFVARHEDGLFLGPPGTGKSHLAQAIGQAVIQQGYRVLYREAHKLLEDLAERRRTYHLEDFKLRTDAQEEQREYRPHQGGVRSPRGELSQSERDWAFAKRALARGDDPEEIIRRIADYRGDEKHPSYARYTVQRLKLHCTRDALTTSSPEILQVVRTKSVAKTEVREGKNICGKCLLKIKNILLCLQSEEECRSQKYSNVKRPLNYASMCCLRTVLQ
jgi:IstB-like ATP binding protein